MCVFVGVGVCLCVCVFVCICLSVCECILLFVCVCLCCGSWVLSCIRPLTRLFVYLFAHKAVCLRICLCMCACVWPCVIKHTGVSFFYLKVSKMSKCVCSHILRFLRQQSTQHAPRATVSEIELITQTLDNNKLVHTSAEINHFEFLERRASVISVT